MAYFSNSTATILTSATGIATVYTEVLSGYLAKIVVTATGTTSTADIVVTGEDSATPILTKANITKASSSTFYPRAAAHKVADGATTSGIVLVEIPIAFERIKIVMAGGGNAQGYTVTAYVH